MFNLKISSSLYTLQLVILFVYIFSAPLWSQKMNGLCFSGPQQPGFTINDFEYFKSSNATWIALVPEATLDRVTLQLTPDTLNNWWSETIPANIEAIQLAKKAGLKIFLKPHIVLGPIPAKRKKKQGVFVNQEEKQAKDKTRKAEWRGDFVAKNEEDWKILEESYKAYLLQLAKIAETHQVAILAVGTEFKQFAIRRPTFWRQLIHEIREIYSGKLTYAANWDEYQKIQFWQDLDYIGVDTYFPINKSATPSVKQTLKNWRPIQKRLRKFSKKQGLQILLTEFGYRSVSYSGKRPWTHDKVPAPVNNMAQANLYQAFFQTFWKKPWVAGGFSWKWFYKAEAATKTSFSIQNKPAESVLKKWYANQK